MKQKTKHNNLDINSDYSDSESECEASSLMLGLFYPTKQQLQRLLITDGTQTPCDTSTVTLSAHKSVIIMFLKKRHFYSASLYNHKNDNR